jgi:hypothetical protein
MALMLNVCPEAHANMISTLLLSFLKGDPVDAAVPSSFWVSYVLGEMGRRGYQAEVVGYIRKNWWPMVKSGGA